MSLAGFRLEICSPSTLIGRGVAAAKSDACDRVYAHGSVKT